MWRPQSLFMSLVNHDACPFDRTDPPSALVVGGHQTRMAWWVVKRKLGSCNCNFGVWSLWKTLILMFYGNAFLVAFPPAFLNAQFGRPCPPKSKVQLFNIFQKAVDKYTLPLRQIHQSNRENKIVHCCLPDCPVVGARQGRRPALLFITSSLSLHLQSSRLLAANTLCHKGQIRIAIGTNAVFQLDKYTVKFRQLLIIILDK